MIDGCYLFANAVIDNFQCIATIKFQVMCNFDQDVIQGFIWIWMFDKLLHLRLHDSCHSICVNGPSTATNIVTLAVDDSMMLCAVSVQFQQEIWITIFVFAFTSVQNPILAALFLKFRNYVCFKVQY